MPQCRRGGILVAAGLVLLALGGCAATAPEPAESESVAPPVEAEPAGDSRNARPASEPSAGAPAGEAGSVDAGPADTEPADTAPVRYRAFGTEALVDLLAAELALRRGDLDTAAQRYTRQARATRDPGVVATAARIAAMAGEREEAVDLARLWAEIAPEDPRARQAAALALIRAGCFEEALDHLVALRELGSEADFGYLAVHAADIPDESREVLLRALAELAQRYPGDPDLAFARAVLLERSERPEEALAVLAPLEPGEYGPDATLLRARLLDALGEAAAAVDWLRAGIDRGGEVGRLRYMLARLLVEQGRLDEARAQFERLLERVGENSEILLSLALISLEAGDPDAARDYLQRLLRVGGRPDAAHYYLGVTASEQGRTEAALDAWRRVGPGFEYERAQASAASLALSSGDPEALRAYLRRAASTASRTVHCAVDARSAGADGCRRAGNRRLGAGCGDRGAPRRDRSALCPRHGPRCRRRRGRHDRGSGADPRTRPGRRHGPERPRLYPGRPGRASRRGAGAGAAGAGVRSAGPGLHRFPRLGRVSPGQSRSGGGAAAPGLGRVP
ncbi:MAG: tetratricopeptide repeat protein [Gammaproteobacteria bacterium]|nr:tetratricopeptide repeat protein [Gammaproteobacteria bacterium]